MSLSTTKYNGVQDGAVRGGCGSMAFISSAFIAALSTIAVSIVYKTNEITILIATFSAVAIVSYIFITNTRVIEGYDDRIVPTDLFSDEMCTKDESGYCNFKQVGSGGKKWGGYSDITTYETIL